MRKQKNSFKFGFKYHNKESALDGTEFELSWNFENEDNSIDIGYQLPDDSCRCYIGDNSDDE